MFGRPPFEIADNCVVEVRDLDVAGAWYKEKLGMKEARDRKTDDSGRPFMDLQFWPGVSLTLVETVQGQGLGKGERPIFFARNLEKAHEWLASRGISVDPITSDSGGNCLFHFRDTEGNAIEVCKES